MADGLLQGMHIAYDLVQQQQLRYLRDIQEALSAPLASRQLRIE